MSTLERLARSVTFDAVTAVRPLGCWVTTAAPNIRGRSRVHLVDTAYALWTGGSPRYVASYACGRGATRACFHIALPADGEPCDDCLIADITGPIVYLCFDVDNELIYVGFSVNFVGRAKQHHRTSSWWPLVHRYETRLQSSVQAGLATEKALIQEHKPRFNRRHTATAIRRSRERSRRKQAAH